MYHRLFAASAALIFATTANAATVVGGSFEQPAVGIGYVYSPGAAGTSFAAGSGVAGNGSAWGFAAAPNGSQVAFIQSYPGLAGQLSLEVTDLVVGARYTASFYLAQRAGFEVNPVSVSLNGAALGTFSPTSSAFSRFTSDAFTAAAANATLTFAGQPFLSGDHAVGLDAVTVDGVSGAAAVAGVPEPATWGMMIAGFGLVGGTMRRRKVAASFA